MANAAQGIAYQNDLKSIAVSKALIYEQFGKHIASGFHVCPFLKSSCDSVIYKVAWLDSQAARIRRAQRELEGPRKSASKVTTVVCRSCGYEVPSHVAFCPVCGSDFDKASLPDHVKMRCSACGVDVESTYAYCPNCGCYLG